MDDELEFLEVIHDGLGLLVVAFEAFDQSLFVVVDPARILGSLSNPLAQGFFVTIKEKKALEFDAFSHNLIPSIQIFFVPRETVDEIAMLESALLHGLPQEVDSDVTLERTINANAYGHNLAIDHDLLDKVAVL